jgi:hypothetical protein
MNRTTKQYLGVLYLFLSWSLSLNLALYSALPFATSVQKKAVHPKQCHLMTVVPNSPCHGLIKLTSPSFVLDLETLGLHP